MEGNISNPKNRNSEEYYGVGSFIWEIAKVFFWAFIIIVPVRVFLFQPFFVQGASMEPNFDNGDYLIVNELGYKRTQVGIDEFTFFTVQPFREIERGDVVVFKYPRNPKQFFIKRVIALPNERVELRDGKVKIINEENPEGFYLEESSYVSEDVFTSGSLNKDLGEEEFFVMGDNRPFSHDSRSWGPISKDDMIGKVLFRTWPLDNIDFY